MQKIKTKNFTLSKKKIFPVFKETSVNMILVYIQYSVIGMQNELFTQSAILDISIIFKLLVL